MAKAKHIHDVTTILLYDRYHTTLKFCKSPGMRVIYMACSAFHVLTETDRPVPQQIYKKN